MLMLLLKVQTKKIGLQVFNCYADLKKKFLTSSDDLWSFEMEIKIDYLWVFQYLFIFHPLNQT